MRKVIFNFHLWSGLTVAIFLLIAASTGIILAFRRPLDVALNPRLLAVQPAADRASWDTLAQAVMREHPNQTPQWIEVQRDPAAALQFRFLNKDEVYVNPYSGEILGARNQNDSFVYKVEKLHRYLLMGDVGEVVTGVTTGLFVFILISGIYLWVPKSRARWRAAFLLDGRLKGRAWNVNLHKVIGIYATAVLLVLALSGVGLALEPLIKAQHDQPVSKQAAKSGGTKRPVVRTEGVSFDDLWRKVQPSVGDFQWVRFGFPQGRNAVVHVTFVAAHNHSNALSYLYVDGHSGNVLRTDLYEQHAGPYRLYLWLTPLHAGETGGIGWRLATVAGALGLIALIVTGGWLFYRRKWAPTRREDRKALAMPRTIDPSASAAGLLDSPHLPGR